MSAHPVFPPSPLNRAIERANGGPVPPMVLSERDGMECFVASSPDGITRPWRERHLHPVPRPVEPRNSHVSEPRPAHPYDQDQRRDDETRSVQATAWAWTLLLREMERSQYQVIKDLAIDFQTQLNPRGNQ